MVDTETGFTQQQYLEIVLAKEKPNLKNVVLLYDVDQVLADILEDQVRAYNNSLDLDIPEKEMKTAVYNRQTFDVPQIGNRRTEDKEKNQKDSTNMLFETARSYILNDPMIHLRFPSIPGSASGSTLLKTMIETYDGTFGGYYTARAPKAGAVTHDWLQKHNFPDGDVIVCNDSKQKLQNIIDNFHLTNPENQSTIFLLDDSVPNLIKASHDLIKESSEDKQESLKYALSHIIIGAFSYTQEELTEKYPSELSIIPFPFWTVDTIGKTITSLSEKNSQH